jgi:hypothetical protein
MGWKPKLNAVCGRCGRSHGLFATCVARGGRKQPLKLTVSYGRCPKCRRSYGPGGALTHACAPKSDFGRRKKAFEAEQAKRERDAKRKARPKHDYAECSDGECKRALCVAYKAGRELGDLEGHERGWQQGYARGLIERVRESRLGPHGSPSGNSRRPGRLGRGRVLLADEAVPLRGPVRAVQGHGAALPPRCPPRPPRRSQGAQAEAPEVSGERLVKGAGVDPGDGEILGEYTDDQPGRRTYHGSNPKWEIAKSLGKMRRMAGTPKPAPWSRVKRRP